MKRKQVPYGTKLPIYFSSEELNDIREHTFVDADFGRHAKIDGNQLRLDLSLDDIEEIQGYIAAEANYTHNNKLSRRLDRLFEKFQKHLEGFYDHEEV